MHRNNHLSFHNLVLFPGEKGIYLSTFVHYLGANLVSLFIPIYVYKITGEITSAFLFYGLYNFLIIISSLPAGWLATKLGVDWTQFIGSLFRAAFLGLLIFGKNNPLFLIFAAVCWGIAIPIYWLPYNYTVVSVKKDKDYSLEASRIKLFINIAEGLCPFLGGLIISLWGFSFVYVVTIILTVLASMPLFFDGFEKKHMHFDLHKIAEEVLEKRNRPFIFAFLGNGIFDAVSGIAWPIYIYIVIRDYETVGAIHSVAFLFALGILWYLGSGIKKRGKLIFNWGLFGCTFIWLGRSFLTTSMAIFLSNIAMGLVGLLLWTPYDAFVYQATEKRRKLEFLIIREITIHSGGLISCFMLLFLLTQKLSWLFAFSIAVVALYFVSQVKKTEEFSGNGAEMKNIK